MFALVIWAPARCTGWENHHRRRAFPNPTGVSLRVDIPPAFPTFTTASPMGTPCLTSLLSRLGPYNKWQPLNFASDYFCMPSLAPTLTTLAPSRDLPRKVINGDRRYTGNFFCPNDTTSKLELILFILRRIVPIKERVRRPRPSTPVRAPDESLSCSRAIHPLIQLPSVCVLTLLCAALLQRA